MGGVPPHIAARLAIRFVRHGCANRPFYHIVVMPVVRAQRDPPIEQLGTYDPMPNENNEKLFTCNLERLKYWLAQDPQISKPLKELLGLVGYFPIHPRTYMRAWNNRFSEKEAAEKAAAETEKMKIEESKTQT